MQAGLAAVAASQAQLQAAVGAVVSAPRRGGGSALNGRADEGGPAALPGSDGEGRRCMTVNKWHHLKTQGPLHARPQRGCGVLPPLEDGAQQSRKGQASPARAAQPLTSCASPKAARAACAGANGAGEARIAPGPPGALGGPSDDGAPPTYKGDPRDTPVDAYYHMQVRGALRRAR